MSDDVQSSRTRAPVTTSSSDTKAIIRSIIGIGIGLATLLLMLAGLLIQQNANVNARIDDVNANVNARIDDVNRRIDDVVVNVNARLDDIQDDIRELRALVTEALKGAEPAD